MKEIFIDKDRVFVMDGNDCIAQIDKDKAIKCLVEQCERMKIYKDFQLWESRRNGLGWDYNVKEEI